jgi:N4-gp56 family major capsid protein
MLTKVADIPQQMLDIYSRLLLMDNMPLLYFRQFTEYKLEFGLEPGERIKFTRHDNLAKGGKLVDEDTPITKNKMTGSEQFITLEEFGNAASFSRRASKASLRNMLEDAKKLLGRDYATVLDEFLRDVFLSTANKYYTKADFTTGTAIGDVAGEFSAAVVDALVEQAKNLLMPKLVRGADRFYAFIGTPRQIRQVRNSTGWLDARKYVNPADMLNGEAGRLNDVVFFDTTQMPNPTNAPAGSTNPAGGIILEGVGSGAANVHRGIFIGADAVGYGESIPMELIPEVPEDFGRKQAIAWYMISGADILNDYLIDVYTVEPMPTSP